MAPVVVHVCESDHKEDSAEELILSNSSDGEDAD